MEKYTGLEVAIIGMSGCFPMAENTNEFWENLKQGKECIRFFTDEELLDLGTPKEAFAQPNFIKAEGFYENRDMFDAEFFGYTPVVAELMDTQIRIFYECCYEALEHSGYNPFFHKGSIGLYAGASNNFFWEVMTNLSQKGNELGLCNAAHLTDKDFISTRMSYKLNLTGPSVTVQTACSTSLAAVHMACQSLLNGECNIALAGGSTIVMNANGAGYMYEPGTILYSDGHCRTFDESSDGTVGGNEAGVVVLKLLEDAIKDNDNILAVIKGSALNNDGVDKANYASPSRQGQSNVIKQAQQVAEVAPETITYIEAHGTGTNISDPIEVEALKKAFNTKKKQFCAIGSVKSNIGHLDSAAGVSSLIKVILAMQNRQIPPSINYHKPNPKIDFDNSPFFVNTELRDWHQNGNPLRAGVSSFGVGGTNVHVILEESPESNDQTGTEEEELIIFSGRNSNVVDKLCKSYGEYLSTNDSKNFPDFAYTLQLGRNKFSHRGYFVSSDKNGAVKFFESGNFQTNVVSGNEKKKVVFFIYRTRSAVP